MMIHAYSELYLSDAKANLADCLGYGVRECGFEPNFFSQIFVQSGYAEQFERGNPGVISGMSGIELAQKIIAYAYPDYMFAERVYENFNEEKTEAYWAGWVLAEFQWETAKRFKDIFSKVSLQEILEMYRVYHEMDISSFVDDLNARLNNVKKDTHLKTIRESLGVSQAELSKMAGVNLRSIQLYEQRVNDIDKAQAATLFKLSRVLGCTVEDLLEAPER